MATGIHVWSQTAANNATADSSINFAEGQAPSSVNDSNRAVMTRLADFYKDLGGLATGGSSTAFTVTTNRAFASAAVMDKSIIVIIPHTTSGASPTLNVDGLGAKAINYSTGVAVPTGALAAGTPYALVYINASTEFIVLGALAVDGATVQLSKLDINGGTAETAPAVADLLALYDASAAANRKMTLENVLKVINSLTAETSPAIDDELALYDLSATATDKITLANLLKVVNGLTEDTSPHVSNDFVLSYDASATAAKKVTLTSILTALLATQDDQESGSSTATLVSPGRQHFHNSAAKVWANLDGTGTAALRVSYNMTSITDNGTGDFTFTIATDFSSANYATTVAAQRATPAGNNNGFTATIINATTASPAAGTIRMAATASATDVNEDPEILNIACFGDQ